MGAVLGQDGVKAIGRYSLAMARLDTRLTVLKDTLSAELLPVAAETAEELLRGITAADVKEFGKFSKDFARDFRDVLIPSLKTLLEAGKDVRSLIKDLGGLGNTVKLLTALWLAYQIQAGLANLQTATLSKTLLVAGKSALTLAARLLLVLAPLLIIEDFAGWKSGKDSIFGEWFGPATQENLRTAEQLLWGILAVLTGLAVLAGGVPLAIGIALGALAALVIEELDLFRQQWFMIWDDFGLFALAWIETIAEALGGVTGALSKFAQVGQVLANPSAAAYNWGAEMALASSRPPVMLGGGSTSTTNNSQSNIQVVVNTPASNPEAVGQAAGQGVDQAARKIHNQYNTGRR